ncbi:hypothetical protein HDU76_005865 [Blyttiomyces sp. JEL0837]|nr:hypothetical protein HDU76_005865 [Blyttiomyces sp. JEL0837]
MPKVPRKNKRSSGKGGDELDDGRLAPHTEVLYKGKFQRFLRYCEDFGLPDPSNVTPETPSDLVRFIEDMFCPDDPHVKALSLSGIESYRSGIKHHYVQVLGLSQGWDIVDGKCIGNPCDSPMFRDCMSDLRRAGRTRFFGNFGIDYVRKTVPGSSVVIGQEFGVRGNVNKAVTIDSVNDAEKKVKGVETSDCRSLQRGESAITQMAPKLHSNNPTLEVSMLSELSSVPIAKEYSASGTQAFLEGNVNTKMEKASDVISDAAWDGEMDFMMEGADSPSPAPIISTAMAVSVTAFMSTVVAPAAETHFEKVAHQDIKPRSIEMAKSAKYGDNFPVPAVDTEVRKDASINNSDVVNESHAIGNIVESSKAVVPIVSADQIHLKTLPEPRAALPLSTTAAAPASPVTSTANIVEDSPIGSMKASAPPTSTISSSAEVCMPFPVPPVVVTTSSPTITKIGTTTSSIANIDMTETDSNDRSNQTNANSSLQPSYVINELDMRKIDDWISRDVAAGGAPELLRSYLKALFRVAFQFWLTVDELRRIRLGDLVQCCDGGIHKHPLPVRLKLRISIVKSENPMDHRDYNIVPNVDAPHLCAHAALLAWKHELDHIYNDQITALNDPLFPSIDHDNIFKWRVALDESTWSRLLDMAVAGAGLLAGDPVTGVPVLGRFGLDCLRRGGAQYRFLYSGPLGLRMATDEVRAWGRFSPDESWESILAYIDGPHATVYALNDLLSAGWVPLSQNAMPTMPTNTPLTQATLTSSVTSMPALTMLPAEGADRIQASTFPPMTPPLSLSAADSNAFIMPFDQQEDRMHNLVLEALQAAKACEVIARQENDKIVNEASVNSGKSEKDGVDKPCCKNDKMEVESELAVFHSVSTDNQAPAFSQSGTMQSAMSVDFPGNWMSYQYYNGQGQPYWDGDKMKTDSVSQPIPDNQSSQQAVVQNHSISKDNIVDNISSGNRKSNNSSMVVENGMYERTLAFIGRRWQILTLLSRMSIKLRDSQQQWCRY